MRLPIDPRLPEIAETVRRHGSAIVVAPPGAGKTTRVPPALLEDGPVLVLQPRRVAARSIARRIAEERGWTLGEEVGWQVRFERRFSKSTRLLIATEGILTARFQSDPLLSGFRTVVLDEFHERTIHADLGLALAREARRARTDLRIVVMSATLDAGPVAAYLDDAPIVEIDARPHPVAIEHRPGAGAVDAALDALSRPGGHVLVFLPGAPEIRRAEEELRRRLPPRNDVRILPLHGMLDAESQDAALAPFDGRKVVLATNLAETSLTIEGVTDVIDTGLHRVPRRDGATGIDRLETERISRDSAAQRAGRAGRTGPGRCLRLWDPRDEMRDRREGEIERIDLASPLLDVLAWGGNPRTFPWFEPPPTWALEESLSLLERLGAIRDGMITPLGSALRRLPLHPRLGRVLLAAADRAEAAAALAAFAEGWVPPGDPVTTDCDLLSRAGRIREAPSHVRRAADELERLVREKGESLPFRRALLLGFPDRVAKRREAGSPRLLLSSGTGAVLGRESGVREGEFVVALDLAGASRAPGAEAIVRTASRIDLEWLAPDSETVRHRLDGETVRADRVSRYGAIVLASAPVAPDPEEASRILAEALLARGLDAESGTFLRRLRFAGIEVDVEAAVRAACAGRTTLPAFALDDWIPPHLRRDLDRLAPMLLRVPSGREVRLDYREDGSVVAAVKIHELFGLIETPRIGPRGVHVVFELLAPNGRPVQTTRDLRSFWERTYPEVRKEMRGRYPKHPWPEDPWSAEPTHRAKARGRG
jgi:ATP-dependent helicase HrpB